MSDKTQKVQAVYDADLEKILGDLGVLEAFKEGKMRCFFCDDVITFDNLELIFSRNKSVAISCNKQECINKFKKEVSEHAT